jgi:SAM-dependent methyltransferase
LSVASHPQSTMRGLVPAVAVISASALAYEILLIRLFSIVEWHHLAFLVISLALLGYGASGTLLALTGPRLRFDVAAAAASAGFGVTSIGSFLVAQRLDLNSLEIFWSTRQFGTLFLLYLLFAVPFFCAATAIGLTLSRFGAESPRLYRADLLGGGISAAAMTALLFFVHPVTALQVVSCAGFAAAALFHRRGFVIATIGIAAAIAARPLALPLRMSQFKELSHALRVPEARVVAERSSPLAMLTAVESPAVPFRHAPGLSLAFGGAIPEQIGVFSDGGGMTPIVAGPRADLAFLDAMPTAVPYHLARPRTVVVIGSGGGMEVLSALHHGATAVTAVEMDPRLVALVREKSRIYDDPRVRVVTAEGRRFIRESEETYDAIQIALVGSHGSSGSGVQALSESYLYAVESMRELVAHLRPGGVLAITRWMQAPPRDIVKLLATAGVAIDDAPRRIALIRGWNTATLIVKRGDLTPSDVAALRGFCEDRSFDLEYAPGVRREETNQYNVMEGSLFDAAHALLGAGREDFLERYKFNVRPATDERPYFFHSFRWSALPELLQLRARGGMPLLEWGYLVLIAGLAQAIVAAVVLILLPLLVVTRRAGRTPTAVPIGGLITYFGAIGLGFLFIEIAFMQRLTFFLGHPLYAIAVVLSSFLVFGGLGSGASARIGMRRARAMPLVVAAAAVVNLLIIRTLTSLAIGLPDVVKILISIAVVAPLAFVMGMPFPLGLRRLASANSSAIPWAWGINGTASVLASMLATLVAVHFGFTVLVVLAAALYVVAYTPRMPALLLVLAMFVAPLLHAQERTLSWKSLDVEARLENDGTLVISERHVIRFDGDWNGGERVFRVAPGQELTLFAVDRIDSRGRTPMSEAGGSGIGLHEYRFDGTTLRWRARNASDRPFRNAERGYVIQYGLRNVIVREGDAYSLHHDFAFPDRPGPIERFSAKLELDPAWQPPEDFQPSYERANLLPGEGAVLKTTLQWKGEGQPQFVGTAPPPTPVQQQPAVHVAPPPPPPPPPPVPMAQKLAAVAVFVFASLALVYWFLRGEERVGRYAPPPQVTPGWLEQHLLVHRAEVVGAAWDGATGAGEVSALLAIMADEGKIENVGGSTPKLRLLVPRESLSEYERAFVSSLFIAGDEIDPQKLRSHYASTGFDPAASITTPLANAARRLVGPGNGSSWALGCMLMVFLGFFFTLNTAAFFATLLLGSFYRSSSLGRSIAALIPVPLLIAAVLHMRFASTLTSLIVNLAVALGFLAVAVRHARWRSGAFEFTNMRHFVAARDFLRRRLLNNDGEIDRRWIPYILAFGLAPELDRWSVATPQPERRADLPGFEEPRFPNPSGGFTSGSPQVAREVFRGGGGSFGGAGATGSWTAMASFAQSVPKPQPVSTSSSSSSSWSSGSSWSSSSSSSSSRSSSSSSSRSGGGGGGGW